MQAEDNQLITYAMYQIPISPARDTNVKNPDFYQNGWELMSRAREMPKVTRT